MLPDEHSDKPASPGKTDPSAASPSEGSIAGIPDTLLANVGHELRTPMNSILGFADLLMEMDLSEEQLTYVKLLRQSGGQLLSMINNILDYSKAAASRIRIDPIPFDLRVLVEDVAYTLAIQAEPKGVELACHVDSGVPAQVVGDPQYLRQILNNLAGNAIKFTSDGEVVIEVSMAGPMCQEADGACRAVLNISVSDTGIGIAPDRQALVFERFAQADPTIARQFGGTGLGLTITKQLVELMGGEIRVDSTPGKGSRFWFTLPVGICQLPESVRPTYQPDITGLRILVADANATYRRILMKMLMNFGCSPVAVGSGRMALEALAHRRFGERPFDLIIMDLTLPDMDGVSLMETINGRTALKDLHRIVLTAMTQRRQAQQLAGLGCRGYLTKPVRESVLQEVIHEVMSSGTADDAPRPLVTRHSVAERKFKGVRVLLAEDNHINAQVTRKVLANSGYSVISTPDGEKAVRAVEREDYDLVLMDVQMPRMDGLTATRQIRSVEAADGRKRLPIVGLTASNLQSDCDACISAGMDAVAFKPIHPKHLTDLIEGLLEGRGAAPASCLPVASPPPAAVPPPIDSVRALERTLGDEQFLQELVDVFGSSVSDQVCSVEAALSAGHLDTVAEIAHKLKGAAGNLCAEGIHALARRLEDAAARGHDAEAWRLLVQLKEEGDRFKAFVADTGWMQFN